MGGRPLSGPGTIFSRFLALPDCCRMATAFGRCRAGCPVQACDLTCSGTAPQPAGRRLPLPPAPCFTRICKITGRVCWPVTAVCRRPPGCGLEKGGCGQRRPSPPRDQRTGRPACPGRGRHRRRRRCRNSCKTSAPPAYVYGGVGRPQTTVPANTGRRVTACSGLQASPAPPLPAGRSRWPAPGKSPVCGSLVCLPGFQESREFPCW